MLLQRVCLPDQPRRKEVGEVEGSNDEFRVKQWRLECQLLHLDLAFFSLCRQRCQESYQRARVSLLP